MRIHLVPGRFLSCLGPLLLLGVSSVASASFSPGNMTPLAEDEMAGVTGAGLAFAMDNFSIRMAPTSYIELTGSAPTPQAAGVGWQRGDARYYGLSMTSGSAAGTDWYGNGCSGGVLSCPIGLGDGSFGVSAFASVYDPFVLRVFQYEGFDYQGLMRNLPDSGLAATMPTVLEFIGPTNSDPWRWAFWGELEVGRQLDGGGNVVGNAGFLQSQTLIYGKPVASGRVWEGGNSYSAGSGSKPAILRLMQTANDADRTLGVTYQSALSGDFRFSVRQTPNSPNQLHAVPDFNDQEGLHFRNVDAFLPLGTLHYQAITFSGISGYDTSANPVAASQNGNFVVELTRIPNIPSIYNHFYCGVTTGTCALDAGGRIASPNQDTHGYVRWGNWANPNGPMGNGINDLPTATSTANGIYFTGGASGGVPTNATVNLGISRIEGMLIQHMKITTLGAGI